MDFLNYFTNQNIEEKKYIKKNFLIKIFKFKESQHNGIFNFSMKKYIYIYFIYLYNIVTIK